MAGRHPAFAPALRSPAQNNALTSRYERVLHRMNQTARRQTRIE